MPSKTKLKNAAMTTIILAHAPLHHAREHAPVVDAAGMTRLVDDDVVMEAPVLLEEVGGRHVPHPL